MVNPDNSPPVRGKNNNSLLERGIRPDIDHCRIGAVSYLNSKPLIEGLQEHAPRSSLILDYPSRLVDRLHSGGDLDVALVPSIACMVHPKLEIVSDACVATHGPVLSVKLYFKVPPREVRTLALDEGSRTSVTLARILLAKRHGVYPILQQLPIGAAIESSTADATLVIGDRAMFPVKLPHQLVWDLGEEWLNWTGFPFVFALWATRSGFDLGEVEEALNEARDRGVRKLEEIAAREAPPLGLDIQTSLDYLRENLYFYLGSAERQGLRRFAELAVELGFVPRGNALVFRHHSFA